MSSRRKICTNMPTFFGKNQRPTPLFHLPGSTPPRLPGCCSWLTLHVGISRVYQFQQGEQPTLHKQTAGIIEKQLSTHHHNVGTVDRSDKGYGTTSFWFKRMRSLDPITNEWLCLSYWFKKRYWEKKKKKVLGSINESIKFLRVDDLQIWGGLPYGVCGNMWKSKRNFRAGSSLPLM